MDQAEYDVLVHDLIVGALTAASRSFDVRVEEPYLVALTFLIGSQPAYVQAGIAALCDLIPDMETMDGVIELLEFCVHVLRPPELVAAVSTVRDVAKSELAGGHVPRAWETAHKCERILDALSEPWPEGSIYTSFNQS